MDQQVSKTRRRSGSGRLSAEDTAGLTDRLLDAATDVFAQYGYAKATMDKIARTAGASTKTLYARYTNKSEIAAAILHRGFDKAIPDLVINAGTGDGENPQAFLARVAEQISLRATSSEARVFTALVMTEAVAHPELGNLYQEGAGRYIELLARRFRHWHTSGRFKLRVKPEQAATAFFDLIAQTPRNRNVLGIPLTSQGRKAHVAAALEIFFNGCGEVQS